MKRLISIIFLSAALAVSCRETVRIDEPLPETVTISVGVGNAENSPTRMTGVTASQESAVNCWTLLVSDNSTGKIIMSVDSGSGGELEVTLPAGRTCSFYAAVNLPDIVWQSYVGKTPTQLKSQVVDLSSVSKGNIPMFGELADLALTSSTGSQEIPVCRLVAKLGIKKVTVNMASAFDASETFILKGIYATNVTTSTNFSFSTLTGWYNRMGWHVLDGSSYDAVTGDVSINRSIAQGASYSTGHYFYSMPNLTSSDTHSSTWSSRHTRLVIEASLGGKTYYYQVNMPVLVHNNSYIVEEAVITKRGSTDPEQEATDAVTVTFSTSTGDWDGPVNITEES